MPSYYAVCVNATTAMNALTQEVANKIGSINTTVSDKIAEMEAWKNSVLPLASGRDFPNGTLIKTNIDFSSFDGMPYTLDISIHQYKNNYPSKILIQGYWYNHNHYALGGFREGYRVEEVKAFLLNNFLCFYIPNMSYWQQFSVCCSAGAGISNAGNRVTSITNEVIPATGVTNLTTVPWLDDLAKYNKNTVKIDLIKYLVSDLYSVQDYSDGGSINYLKDKSGIFKILDCNGAHYITTSKSFYLEAGKYAFNLSYDYVSEDITYTHSSQTVGNSIGVGISLRNSSMATLTDIFIIDGPALSVNNTNLKSNNINIAQTDHYNLCLRLNGYAGKKRVNITEASIVKLY